MRIHTSLLMGVVSVVILGGCLPRGAGRESYEGCAISADCGNTSDRCLTVVNGSFSDSMCSSTCGGPGRFCPSDWMGAAGDCRDVAGTGDFNCFQACASNSDCLSGFRCLIPGTGGAAICLPGTGGSGPLLVGAYESCASSSVACDGSTQGCFGIRNGSFMTNICTTECRSDNDCPFDIRGGRGACLDIEGGSMGVCFERCTFQSDCQFDAVCTDVTASGLDLPVPICLPG